MAVLRAESIKDASVCDFFIFFGGGFGGRGGWCFFFFILYFFFGGDLGASLAPVWAVSSPGCAWRGCWVGGGKGGMNAKWQGLISFAEVPP